MANSRETKKKVREERAYQATQAQKSFEKTVFGALIPYMDQQDETPHLQRLIDRMQYIDVDAFNILDK